MKISNLETLYPLNEDFEANERKKAIKDCIKEIEKIYSYEAFRLKKRSLEDQTIIGHRDTVILSDIKNTLKKML